ncbi:head maturation protease, ClpP-related [Microbacterium sp. Yaish 1]|uniref:head maturation protease, ClpP-related n=1 Tax=Microbacterium sp. Yaish 1 TaxID=2025014 RepID=UPI000B93BFFF|nr:head maturation protease, ClpP-related [Microbacterium sp. Yaish 1]OYC97217.1 hypothetical protein CI089_01290 [Microbacterium sp. Yaish 1]
MTDKHKKQERRYWGSIEPPKAKADFFSAVTAPTADGDATVATIRMYGPIDSWGGWWGISTEDVGRVLDALPDTVEQIVLRINSPGGEVWEAMAILNMLAAHHAQVIAVVDGIAASAASFIAASCDETVMSRGSQMMIHSPWSFAIGNAADMRKQAAFLDTLERSMIEVYAEKAGERDWATLLAEETWLTASDTVELGLADRVDVVPDAGTATTVGTDDDVLVILSGTDEDIDDDDEASARAARIHAAAASARAAAPRPPDSTEPGTTANKEELPMSDKFLADVRDRLGITDANATEETVLAAFDQRIAAPAPTPTAALPEGVVAVEATQLEQMRADAQAGREARDAQLAAARAATVDAAVADGRISPARRDHWVAALAADPGSAEILAGLEKGLIPVDLVGVTGGVDEASDEDATFSKLFPTEKGA